MKNFILFFCFIILSPIISSSEETCFLVKDHDIVYIQDGDIHIRHNPGCDFSIALSLMGFDSSILENENTPVWYFEEGFETFLNVWKEPHRPRTWILDSCVWYSGNIIEKIGLEAIKHYIEKFNYGNKDVTGINRFDWPGALLISADEQVEFLQRLIDRELFVTPKAYEMTEKILFVQDLPSKWKLYGKTGIGEGEDSKRVGWFIGWIEKRDRKIPFASYVIHHKVGTFPSIIAKNNAIFNLFCLIHGLEK